MIVCFVECLGVLDSIGLMNAIVKIKQIRTLRQSFWYMLRTMAILLLLTLPPAMAPAQHNKPVLNHIAHYVHDLGKSTDFYLNIVGLDTIPNPFRDNKHTWFSIGYKSHLHLLAGAEPPKQHNKNIHLCFSVPDIDLFIAKLTKARIPFEDWPGNKQQVTLRSDGVKQIYFTDPDGYWVEINNAKD